MDRVALGEIVVRDREEKRAGRPGARASGTVPGRRYAHPTRGRGRCREGRRQRSPRDRPSTAIHERWPWDRSRRTFAGVGVQRLLGRPCDRRRVTTPPFSRSSATLTAPAGWPNEAPRKSRTMLWRAAALRGSRRSPAQLVCALRRDVRQLHDSRRLCPGSSSRGLGQAGVSLSRTSETSSGSDPCLRRLQLGGGPGSSSQERRSPSGTLTVRAVPPVDGLYAVAALQTHLPGRSSRARTATSDQEAVASRQGRPCPGRCRPSRTAPVDRP